ncbi:MAG: multidrug effflux MFS transporter [Pseudomonadota bacterium]
MSSQSDIPKRSFLSGARTPPHIITLVLLAGTSVMTMNIFLPVLPQIGIALQTTPAVAQYVLTLFLGATAIAQLFVGPMSDRFGRRPVLLVSGVIFMIATLICYVAPTIEILLAGRVLQASSAAAIALSRAIIRDLFDRSRAASMIGYVTMAMAVLPMITPMLGGYVGALYGWRAPFLVLLAVSAAMLLIIYFDLGETHEPVRNPVSQQMADYVSLLKEPAIWGYLLCATFASGAFFAFLGGAPFIASNVLGMTPDRLGLYLGVVAIGYMAGNFISGRFSERIGIEWMMVLGGLICTIGASLILLLMTLLTPSPAFLFFPMCLVGLGNGMTLPNANAGAVSVRPSLAGSASGLGGFLQIGGGAALAALAGGLITVSNAGVPLYFIMTGTSLAGAFVAVLMLWYSRHAPVAAVE